MQDDEFEWDDAKADANWRKHRVAFEEAARVFEDAYAVVEDQDREAYGEDRFLITAGSATGF